MNLKTGGDHLGPFTRRLEIVKPYDRCRVAVISLSIALAVQLVAARVFFFVLTKRVLPVVRLYRPVADRHGLHPRPGDL